MQSYTHEESRLKRDICDYREQFWNVFKFPPEISSLHLSPGLSLSLSLEKLNVTANL